MDHNTGTDIYVLPSTFVVEGLGRYTRGDSTLALRLSEAVEQPLTVILELAKGSAVVEYIAHEVVSVCRALGGANVDVLLLKDRRDKAGGLRKPIERQVLDRRKIIHFYGKVPPAHVAASS